uniref:Uncharacterized protein n=1 Tax=Oryzias latipes TaxID=8090 RepID=A0A3P9LJT2_ORYLA
MHTPTCTKHNPSRCIVGKGDNPPPHTHTHTSPWDPSIHSAQSSGMGKAFKQEIMGVSVKENKFLFYFLYIRHDSMQMLHAQSVCVILHCL